MLRRSGEGGRTRRLAPALLPASGHTAHRRGGAEGPRRSSTEQTGENHTHTQGHVMQQSTSDSGRRRSGGGGGGASLTRASAGRLASGPCLRRCEDGRGRLRRAGDHHVHDGSDYPVRGVCAKRLSSNLTTYRLETACTTTRTLPECNCHCFPCLLCVPRLETCTLGCPPRGASSALRDTDLFIFWGAYCLWFVPLLRMFKGTAGWRRACACARDKADESTPAHTPTYRRAQAVNGEFV